MSIKISREEKRGGGWSFCNWFRALTRGGPISRRRVSMGVGGVIDRTWPAGPGPSSFIQHPAPGWVKEKKNRRELYTWYIYIFFCYLAETPQEQQQQQSLIGVERLANAIHFALRFLYPFFFFPFLCLAVGSTRPLTSSSSSSKAHGYAGWVCVSSLALDWLTRNQLQCVQERRSLPPQLFPLDT